MKISGGPSVAGFHHRQKERPTIMARHALPINKAAFLGAAIKRLLTCRVKIPTTEHFPCCKINLTIHVAIVNIIFTADLAVPYFSTGFGPFDTDKWLKSQLQDLFVANQQ